MATISNTSRPGYVWDATDNCWYPIGTGPHTHAYIPEAIVDAKGDLISATADNTPSRLAVGNNGETLVADSSTSTGLRWQGNFAAGKNKIINGDFSINQRAFSSTTTSLDYGFDRWTNTMVDGTVTYSSQSFTPGTAPVLGYEAANYCRFVTTGQTLSTTQARLKQHIEDVRTFAGQTVTASFWAKAASGTPNIAVSFSQVFGTGGSANVSNIGAIKTTINTTWNRYSFTISIPSISGKTIGTNSYLQFNIWFSAGSNFDSATNTMGIQSNTFDIWGVQVESGSVATPFQTATGTLAGELNACMRYFQVLGGTSGNEGLAVGFNYATTSAVCVLPFRQQMRSAPTLSLGTGAAASDFGIYNASGVPLTVTGFTFIDAALGSSRVLAAVASGLVQGNGTNLITNSTAGKLFVSAEL